MEKIIQVKLIFEFFKVVNHLWIKIGASGKLDISKPKSTSLSMDLQICFSLTQDEEM